MRRALGGLHLAAFCLLAWAALGTLPAHADAAASQSLVIRHMSAVAAGQGAHSLGATPPGGLFPCLCSDVPHTIGVGVSYDGGKGACRLGGYGEWHVGIPSGENLWASCLASNKYPNGETYADTYVAHNRTGLGVGAVLSGLLTALGALLTSALSGVSSKEGISAVGGLLRGQRPFVDDYQDWLAKGAAEGKDLVQKGNVRVLVSPTPAEGKPADASPAAHADDAKKLADVEKELEDAANRLKAEGKYIANGSMFDKAIYGVPHLAKETGRWLEDLLPDVPPTDPTTLDLQHKLIGTPVVITDSPPPRPDVDPNWGQCGQAVDWGAKTMEEPVRKIFGPDAVFTKIELQSNANSLGNHTANEVIAPSGERYVIDMWETMVDGKPKIYKEADWIENWKSKGWIGESVTVTRGDNTSTYEAVLEQDIRERGLEDGIKAFRAAYRHNSAKAETVIKSYKLHPWSVGDASAPADPPPPSSYWGRSR